MQAGDLHPARSWESREQAPECTTRGQQQQVPRAVTFTRRGIISPPA